MPEMPVVTVDTATQTVTATPGPESVVVMINDPTPTNTTIAGMARGVPGPPGNADPTQINALIQAALVGLPTAASAVPAVAGTATQLANTLTGVDGETYTFFTTASEDVLFAVGVDGDTFPRLAMDTQGFLWVGDGTVDPFVSGEAFAEVTPNGILLRGYFSTETAGLDIAGDSTLRGVVTFNSAPVFHAGVPADQITYNNSTSGLMAAEIQDAIDGLAARDVTDIISSGGTIDAGINSGVSGSEVDLNINRTLDSTYITDFSQAVQEYAAGLGFVQTGPYAVTGPNTVAPPAGSLVMFDTTDGDGVVNLPLDFGGTSFVIKKMDASAHVVTINPQPGATIEGAPNLILSAAWASVFLVATGSGIWVVVSAT